MTLPHEAPSGGLSRDAAAALALEVSRASGYRGEVLRLVGEGGATDGWAVRVRALVAGGSRLLRSREAWERYRGSTRGELRQMVGTEQAETAGPPPPPNGHTVAPAGGHDFEGHPLLDEMEASLDVAGGQGAPAPPSGALGRWRGATETAIAEAEREAARLLACAAGLQQQAAALTRDARLLRRALTLVAGSVPAAAGPAAPVGPTLRERVLGWARAHGGALVVGEACTGLGLSVKQVAGAASHLEHAGLVERLGRGRYRLVVATVAAG